MDVPRVRAKHDASHEAGDPARKRKATPMNRKLPTQEERDEHPANAAELVAIDVARTALIGAQHRCHITKLQARTLASRLESLISRKPPTIHAVASYAKRVRNARLEAKRQERRAQSDYVHAMWAPFRRGLPKIVIEPLPDHAAEVVAPKRLSLAPTPIAKAQDWEGWDNLQAFLEDAKQTGERIAIITVSHGPECSTVRGFAAAARKGTTSKWLELVGALTYALLGLPAGTPE